ncbi:MAG: hypothetical protein K6F76_05750 [Clostridiales bacterium]|nr:hypothetical protein [Clostridiales bacterium]
MNDQKKSMSSKMNLLFSAFLVFAFTICSYFIDSFSVNIQNQTLRNALPIILFAVFGLFLFYATRVGDGKPVYRFSFSALLLIVLPGLLVFLAYITEGMPFHEQIVSNGQNMARIAACAFGYGLPYMFISGFELSVNQDCEAEVIEDESESFEDNSDNIAQDVIEEETLEESTDTAPEMSDLSEETQNEITDETAEDTNEKINEEPQDKTDLNGENE